MARGRRLIARRIGHVPVAVTAGAPTLTSIGRAAVSAGGGAQVTVVGTNLTGAAITVGSVAATVTSSGPGFVVFAAPAQAANTYNVTATTVGGSATLTGALEYLPVPTTIFAQDSFPSNSFGGWATQAWDNGGATPSSIAIVAHPNTAELNAKSVGGYDGTPTHQNVGGAQLRKVHGNNPAAANAQGKYTQWGIRVTQELLDAVVNNSVTGGQMKLYLYRDIAVTDRNSIVLAIGTQARGLQIAVFRDDGNVNTSGTGYDGIAFTSGDTHLYPAVGDLVEILLWERNDGTTGYAKLWLNGKRVLNISVANGGAVGSGQIGSPNAATSYETRVGNAYIENCDGSPVLYITHAYVADGVIAGIGGF